MTIERRLEAYGGTWLALLDEMDALDPKALVARPLAGKWTILETIEHLVLAERAVCRALPDPSRLVIHERTLEHRVRYHLVMFVLTFGIRVRVPSPVMVPRGGSSLRELRGLRVQNHDWLRSCIDVLGPDVIRGAICDHPIAGPLTMEQAIRMGQVHIEGHVRQIRTLQRRLG